MTDNWINDEVDQAQREYGTWPACLKRPQPLDETQVIPPPPEPLREVTFYLEGDESPAIHVKVEESSLHELQQVRDRWAQVDEVRVDLPDGSHASWAVPRVENQCLLLVAGKLQEEKGVSFRQACEVPVPPALFHFFTKYALDAFRVLRVKHPTLGTIELRITAETLERVGDQVLR
mgnify:CR=1 FL=1